MNSDTAPALTDSMTAALTVVANGGSDQALKAAGITARTTKALVARELLVFDGIQWQITPAGRDAVGIPAPVVEAAQPIGVEDTAPVVPKPAKRRSKTPRKCACDCGGMTGGGLWLPGHDARRAGQVGRMLAQDLDTTDPDELVARASEFLPAGADRIALKAARVALGAITKAQAKQGA